VAHNMKVETLGLCTVSFVSSLAVRHWHERELGARPTPSAK